MGFTTVPDKAGGDVFTEAMWDTYIRDNMNTGMPVILGETSLGASAASITYSGLPSGWKHLYLAGYSRGDAVATNVAVNVRFNSDSGANYDYQYMLASGATPS